MGLHAAGVNCNGGSLIWRTVLHRSYSPISPHAATTGAPGLDRLIAALRAPACYPHAVDNVELLQTHISCVLLAGDYAYKIKKPVNLGFLDFSTLGARRHYCEEELRLNRRTAPGLYLDVVPISGSESAPVKWKKGAATGECRGGIHGENTNC